MSSLDQPQPPPKVLPRTNKNTLPKVYSNFDKPANPKTQVNQPTCKQNPTNSLSKAQNFGAIPKPKQRITNTHSPPPNVTGPLDPIYNKEGSQLPGAKDSSQKTLNSTEPPSSTEIRARFDAKRTSIAFTPPNLTTKQGMPALIFKKEDYMVTLASRC